MRSGESELMAFGAYIFGCKGQYPDREELGFFADADPFGFILFSRNVESPGQIRRLACELREAVGRNAPILIDQEGGRVQRLRPPYWREWPPPLEQCEGLSADAAARAMWIRYRRISDELRDCGINANCVPMADIATEDTHPIIRNRCYAYDAARVSRLAQAAADGTASGSVLPVLKHIPGHGRPSGDSHVELPTTAATLEELESADFRPFSDLADLPLGMTAHVVYESIDRDRPATQSPCVIEIVRERIGFAGLLMTDDISMSALAGSIEERCEASLSAGCDLVLHCNGDLNEMKSVAHSSGALAESAQEKAECAIDAVSSPCQSLDASELDAEFDLILRTKSN